MAEIEEEAFHDAQESFRNEPDESLTPEEKISQAESYNKKGNELYLQGKFTDAALQYRNAVIYNQGELKYRTNLAAAYLEEKSYESCIDECEKGIELSTTKNFPMELVAKAYTRMGKAHQKLMNWSKAEESYKTAADNYDSAIAVKLQDDLKEVVRKHELRQDDAKMSISDHFEYAKELEGEEKLEEALGQMKRVLEKQPGHPEASIEATRLQAVVNERNEKLKTEMIGKLKDLGNVFLKPFGMSCDSFQLDKTEAGGYSISMKK